MKGTTVNQGDYVIYTIEASGCQSQVAVQSASQSLEKHSVHGQYQRIRPYIPGNADRDTQPGYVTVPRLFTQWRGDDAEKTWQDVLRASLEKYADIVTIHADIVTIHADPWQMLPGYPQGEL
jgi:hypothetical protein